MSEMLYKDAQARAAFTDGVADSSVLLYSLGTTHAVATVPEAWHGCRVWATVRGTAAKSCWYLFSSLSTAEVDRTIAAAADGAGDPKLGERIVVGESIPLDVPKPGAQGGSVYLALETDDATTTLQLVRGSAK